MLAKISGAVAGVMLLSGVAIAANDGGVKTPSSVSESMPEMSGGQSHPTMKEGAKRKKRAAKRNQRAKRKTANPSSVSESMPEMAGGQSHPTMGSGSTRGSAPAGPAGSARNTSPSSVNESMPEMSGKQSHPTMGK